MITICTRESGVLIDSESGHYLGRHFVFDGDRIRSARYCYSWQKCPRLKGVFAGVIQPMANGEWKSGNYAGLTYEEIVRQMFADG